MGIGFNLNLPPLFLIFAIFKCMRLANFSDEYNPASECAAQLAGLPHPSKRSVNTRTADRKRTDRTGSPSTRTLPLLSPYIFRRPQPRLDI